MPAFEELGLCRELLEAIADAEVGWNIPTGVQDETIPLMLGGGDVMVAAETGSGKTGAFALPILQLVYERKQKLSQKKESARRKIHPKLPVQWNADDRDPQLALGADGLSCQCREHYAWKGVRANTGCSSGAAYYEGIVEDEGLCRIGWASLGADRNLGVCAGGYGFGGTGMKSNGKRFEKYGEAFGKGDVVGCTLDWNARTISFSKNGADLGVAFRLGNTQGPLFPAVVVKNAEMRFNFGATPFVHSPPNDNVVAVGSLEVKHRAEAPTRTASACEGPSALVMAPTRDLAQQTYESFCLLSTYMNTPHVGCCLLVGGVSTKAEEAALRKGAVDIVIGTPGKMLDFVKRKKLRLENVSTFVLDEADRLLDEGNLAVVMEIFGSLSRGSAGEDRLQVCFFSATLHSPEIKRLSENICHRPTWVDLKGIDSVPDTVNHFSVIVGPSHKSYSTAWGDSQCSACTDRVHANDAAFGALAPDDTPESFSEGVKRVKLLALKMLIDNIKPEQCIVFCRTNLDCDNVEKFLVAAGGGRRFAGATVSGKENLYSCCVVAGWRSTHERRTNLEAFKAGDVRILVCTDVAARGIDVKGLPCVINLTLPDNPETYIHRVGRVGRAGCHGVAVSIVADDGVKEKVWFCQKGKRPPCADTRLFDHGGNCVWYEESEHLIAVEERLGQQPGTIPRIAQCMLPENVKLGEGGAGEWASQRSKEAAAAAERIAQMKPTVETLRELEADVQTQWLLLRHGTYK